MYYKKRNKVFHLYYNDSSGKLRSISTKCITKKEANLFAMEFFTMQKVRKDSIKEYTYSEFKNFYLRYASSRFSQNYQEFIKIAFNQFVKVIEPDKNLSDITIIDIENFITLKRQKTREHIVNGYLRTLQ